MLGLDRRTLRPALLIAAAVVLFAIGVPVVNSLVQRTSPIEVGTVYPIGLDVTFTPDSGWSYSDLHQSAATSGNGGAAVTRAGVDFSVSTGAFAGTLTEFNTTMTEQVTANDDLRGTTSSRTVTTPQGVPGVLTTYRGATTDAMTYAFLHEGAAVQIVVRGPSAALAHELGSVQRMVDSLTWPKEPAPLAKEALKRDARDASGTTGSTGTDSAGTGSSATTEEGGK